MISILSLLLVAGKLKEKKIIYYAGLEKGDKRKADFYRRIEKFGFETRIKPVVKFKRKFYWKSFRCPKCKQRVIKKRKRAV